jgi:ABC-type glycerol-3-phosphate transport system substrate-binding protein
VPYGTNIVIDSDAFVMPTGTKHPKEAAQLMLYMMGTAPVLTWCVDEANIPPTRAALFDPRFVKGVPTDASVVQTARLALEDPRILVPFPSSSIYDFATSQWIAAEQEVEFGRKSPQGALGGLQKALDQREAAVKRGNPDWYRNGD